MKVVQVHNRYRVPGGEDRVVDATVGLLRRRGVQVSLLSRDSGGIPDSMRSRMGAFFSSLYSRSAYVEMAGLVAGDRPDVVHVHNVYPLISPSVVLACRRADVPVVMTCHNFRLICPLGELFSRGEVCERCTRGREYMCILRNCRGRPFESIAYAVRGMVARNLGWLRDGVAFFVTPTRFVASRLIADGFPAERFVVIPHAVAIPDAAADPRAGRYAVFVGRVSVEKGAEVLLRAAAACPQVPVRVAGDWSRRPDLQAAAPPNVRFVGRLSPDEMSKLYGDARFVVVPSLSLETFSLVAAEAMAYGLPVVASEIGGLPEVVEDGSTGLLCQPGNVEELSSRMRLLWEDADLCARLGQEGRRKAGREYGEDIHYVRLMGAYERAIGLHKGEQGTASRG